MSKGENLGKQGVYKFIADCGRMGIMEGVFIASRRDIADINGTEVHFGEALGKHSDVSIFMGPDVLTLLTEDKAAVALVSEHNLSSGYNPFDYIDGEE